MKKLLILLAIFVTFKAYSQNTTTLPTSPATVSFTPSFRWWSTIGITDSLRRIYLQTPGGGWNWIYSAAQTNLIFQTKADNNLQYVRRDSSASSTIPFSQIYHGNIDSIRNSSIIYVGHGATYGAGLPIPDSLTSNAGTILITSGRKGTGGGFDGFGQILLGKQIRHRTTTAGVYGAWIVDALESRTFTAGIGLLGGGDLSANRTLYADTSTLVTKVFAGRYAINTSVIHTTGAETKTSAATGTTATLTVNNTSTGRALTIGGDVVASASKFNITSNGSFIPNNNTGLLNVTSSGSITTANQTSFLAAYFGSTATVTGGSMGVVGIDNSSRSAPTALFLKGYNSAGNYDAGLISTGFLGVSPDGNPSNIGEYFTASPEQVQVGPHKFLTGDIYYPLKFNMKGLPVTTTHFTNTGMYFGTRYGFIGDASASGSPFYNDIMTSFGFKIYSNADANTVTGYQFNGYDGRGGTELELMRLEGKKLYVGGTSTFSTSLGTVAINTSSSPSVVVSATSGSSTTRQNVADFNVRNKSIFSSDSLLSRFQAGQILYQNLANGFIQNINMAPITQNGNILIRNGVNETVAFLSDIPGGGGGSIVNSFNGRTGAVVPVSGDYSSFYASVGNYITALTGDITASGPGSATATLPTVNSNVGSYNNVTVNGKGLVTAASNVGYYSPSDTTATLVTKQFATKYAPLAANNNFTGKNQLSPTYTASSGNEFGLQLTPVGSQTGTAAATDLLINRTGTFGSSGQGFIDARVNNVTRFLVDAQGIIYGQSRLALGSLNNALAIIDASTTTFSSGNSFGMSGFGLRMGVSTFTSTATAGSPVNATAHSFATPTFAASNSQAITDGATVFIQGAPIPSTNVTIANPLAFKVASGNAKFGGNIQMAGSTSGIISVTTQATAGTYNFNMPTTAGAPGQVLTSNGGGNSVMTWGDTDAVLAIITSVSGTTTGTTTYTPPTGKQALITRIGVQATTATNVTNGPTIDVTTVTTGDIFNSTAIAALTSTNKIFWFNGNGMSTVVASGATANINITTGATGSTPTLTLKYIIYGTLQ